MRTFYALVAAGLVVLGCATVQVPQAADADVQRAEASWPGTTLSELHHGRELYIARCTGCHQPVLPRRFTRLEWPAHVAEMRKRAHLDTAEADLVVRFLITMAEAPERP